MSTARIIVLWCISVIVILGGWYFVSPTDEYKVKIKEIDKEVAETRLDLEQLKKSIDKMTQPSTSHPRESISPTPCLSSSSSEKKIVEGTITGRASNLKGRLELSLSYYGHCSLKVVVFENTGIPTDRLQRGAQISVQGKVSSYKGVLEITPEKSVDIRFRAAQ